MGSLARSGGARFGFRHLDAEPAQIEWGVALAEDGAGDTPESGHRLGPVLPAGYSSSGTRSIPVVPKASA